MTTQKAQLDELRRRQALSLTEKVEWAEDRIKEWYEAWDGQVYVAFSGGKDSKVLLHIVRRLYPDVPAVFVNTGLEYPEITHFVKDHENVITMRPKIPFNKVLEKHGFPVVSKKQARYINDVQKANQNNKATVNLRLTGYNRKGEYLPSMRISKKWLPLIDSGFKVSEKCCDVMKKEPMHRYERETGRRPMTGVMAHESNMREKQYLRNGCNAFELKQHPISAPLSIWLEEDVWAYKGLHNLEFSPIYDIVPRTGCMFCMFGVHLDKGENRFQLMKKTHPKQYKYCIEDLGCGAVLDFIGVPY